MNYSCKNYNKEANYLYKEEKKEIAKKLTENESNPSSMNYKIIINGNDNLNNDFSCNKKSNVEESNYFDYDINFHRDSYKRNNVPKSKKSITKKNRINNLCMKSAEINGENLKNSFISINKETITKYQHLFSDVDVCNYKSNRSNLRTPKNLMITQLEDGDLTNFQKIPKMCSSNLLNYSEDCTNKINIKSNCIKSCPAQEEENIIQY